MLLCGGGVRRFRVTFSHGFSFQIDPVSAVQEPVEDGIGQSVTADDLMPVVDRHLLGHNRGADSVTIAEQLERTVDTYNSRSSNPRKQP